MFVLELKCYGMKLCVKYYSYGIINYWRNWCFKWGCC